MDNIEGIHRVSILTEHNKKEKDKFLAYLFNGALDLLNHLDNCIWHLYLYYV